MHQAGPQEAKEAIAVTEKVRHDWSNMPFPHRAMIFRKAADLIATRHRARMNAVTMLGTAKTAWQAEIDSAVEQCDFLRLNTNFAEQVYGEQPLLQSPSTWNRFNIRALEGYVAAISPFNFAAIGTNLNASPALMGNTTIWKPSPNAVLENYVSLQILREAGLPDGVINFLPSSPEVFQSVVTDQHMAGLHFTGSTAVFSHLWTQIGQNITKYKSYPRIVGETGGKNVHIVHPSVASNQDDLTHAALSTVRGAFEYQGQKCSACSVLYVAKSVWEKGFKDILVNTTNTIKPGQPQDLSRFMSAVIHAQAAATHKQYIDEARARDDCTILAGGNVDTSEGYFVEPTIILTTNPTAPTMHKELFGPVLTVYVYDDAKPGFWADTLKQIDANSLYALTGAVFSTDRSALVEAENYLQHACGNLYLNDKSTGAVVGEQPFGGSRASGTNDKAGSALNLWRWVSGQTVKESTTRITSHVYPHMLG